MTEDCTVTTLFFLMRSFSKPTRIYLRLPNWVGDTCMALPSLDLLNQTGVPVVACGRAWGANLLAHMPLEDYLPFGKKILDNRQVLRAHIKAHPQPGGRNVGLLLPDSLSSALSFRLAGLPCAGYRDDGRSFLLRWPIQKPPQALHAVESWYEVTRQALRLWGLPHGPVTPSPRASLKLGQEDHQQAKDCLEKAGLQERPFIMIAPTATGLHQGKIKVWPHYEALTQALQAQGWEVVMSPPPDEIEVARRNAPSATLLPPLPLRPFAALTTRAALVICNDSGVSHIAAAASARQLTLFGVSDPDDSRPWSPFANYIGNQHGWPSLEQVLARIAGLLASSA